MTDPTDPSDPTDRMSAPPPPGAAPRRRIRARYVVAAVVCVGAVAFLISKAEEAAVYLRPVSEAVERRADQGDRTFRMGGSVVAGSVAETADGVAFDITEGGETVAVVHHGDPPDLFDDGAPVVVEGRWVGEVFDSDRLLIRHGNEYSEYEVPQGGETGEDEDA